MKNNVMFLLGMAMSIMAYGQKQTQITLEEMSIIPPDFTGIATTLQDHEIESIHDYLCNYIKCPQGSSGCCFPGTEVIAFVVTSTGELTGFRVINSVSSAIDDEVIRVLKTTSGNWMPGFINGEPVSMEQEVSLVFIPSNNYDIVKEAKTYLDKGNKILFIKKNPKRALKCFNEAFRLLPNKESILAARSICKYQMGDEQGAIQDCSRIIALNSFDGIQLDAADPIELLDQLMGYADEAIAYNQDLLFERVSD